MLRSYLQQGNVKKPQKIDQTDPPPPSLLRVNVHSASLLNRSQLNIIYFYQYQHYLFV